MRLADMERVMGAPSEREGPIITWERLGRGETRLGFAVRVRNGRAVALLAYEGWGN
jgi:hypothetical protein